MGEVQAKRYDVFISYKREDDAAREVLCSALQQAGFEPWWDAKLGQGDFRDQLRDEINRCDVVIALWSKNAHARPDEVKMEMAHAFGVSKLLPLRLDDAPIPRQFAKENFLPFDAWSNGHHATRQLDHILAEARKLGARPSLVPRPCIGVDFPVDLGDLPAAPSRLIGRDAEMNMLRNAWNDRVTTAVVLHALGGAGKSALLRAFVNERLAAGGDGAARVYGWSAYSQGSGDQKRADADTFLARALADFGYEGPPIRDSVESGRTLARLVQRERVLMLLDGMEPLQDPPGTAKGRFKDKGLAAFLRALAAKNPGLLILTSRQEVPELEGFGDLVLRHPLEELSDAAGADLLVDLGTSGRRAELEAAVREVRGHALSVTLLGTFLAEVCDGDIQKRERFDFSDIILSAGEHENVDRTVHYAKRAEKILEAYLERFDELSSGAGRIGGPERALLRLIGLFDRPADGAAVDVLLETQIAGLTDELFVARVGRRGFLGFGRRTVSCILSPEERVYLLREAKSRLRKCRLLANADAQDPHALDAHPMVRAFFTGWLERHAVEPTKAAHDKLYRHYAAAAPDLPDTLAEMQPLFFAAQHGVKAGHVQDAFDKIFSRRIYRGAQHHISRTLGAFGATLSTVSNFFSDPWSKPNPLLTKGAQSFALSSASFALGAMGRLRESIAPREAARISDIEDKRWDGASVDGEMLSFTFLFLGDIARAVQMAEENTQCVLKSGSKFRYACNLSALANALACSGQSERAVSCFEEVETAEGEPLISLRGYQFGELLIDRGDLAGALERARYQLEFVQTESSEVVKLLDIALAWLLLGRVQDLLGDKAASESLETAVAGFHRASQAQWMPPALLARAAHRRKRVAAGELELLDRVWEDLDEVAEIAEPEMRLYLADLALERARLALDVPSAFDDPSAEAAHQIATAAQLIAETGYHRRDGELADLQARLAP